MTLFENILIDSYRKLEEINHKFDVIGDSIDPKNPIVSNKEEFIKICEGIIEKLDNVKSNIIRINNIVK